MFEYCIEKIGGWIFSMVKEPRFWKIEIINYIFYSITMITLEVEKDKLIIGEKYYVKRKKRFHSMYIKNCYGIFDGHNFEGFGFIWFRIDTGLIELDSQLNTFYKYVTREEFYKKVKEKYDAKCLNIILKRLVDESFQW